MDLFRSNQRGYGLGEFEGAKFNEDKNKWIPGHVRWTWGVTGEIQWRDHLMGVRLLGQGVLCDDNKVWYACLDIDVYNIDYQEEMDRIRRSKLPLVVTRTKSGGLRIIVLFNEAIDAEQVVSRMRRVAASLGYSGCEIFPKQTSLIVEKDDCPSWIYVPFGGTGDVFAEQGCMTDNGNLMDLSDAVMHMKDMRISKSKFLEMFAEEEAAKANGKTNGKKHPQGKWVEEESYEVTLNTMFHDGPVCLWIISHRKCRELQNNFLTNVCTFLKKKYPENWDKALEWVNYNVLQPVGDRDKLHDMIKRRHKDDYEYACGDEPIHTFCDAHACRKQKYGVGSNGVDSYEWGMTIVNRIPQTFIINIGGKRISFEAPELMNQTAYQTKCLAYGVPIPYTIDKKEWIKRINLNSQDATMVEPKGVMRTGAFEMELMTKFLSFYIPTFMRVGPKSTDAVRVKEKERRIYFKGDVLMRYCLDVLSKKEQDKIREFISNEDNCRYHDQYDGRDWFRCRYSIPYDKFDEETQDKWFRPDELNDGDGHGTVDRATEGNEQNVKTDKRETRQDGNK
jgi:hypothetical protein